MRIELNGEAAELADDATVEDAVRAVGIELNGRGIAVAVDGDVVRRPDWQGVALRDGQSVEVVRAVQGG